MKKFLVLIFVIAILTTSFQLATAQYMGNVQSSSETGAATLEETLQLARDKINADESVTTITENGSPYLGDPNAPITLVEFGDYQCTFCNRFFHNTEPKLVENYIETGKVKMIFKDFTIIGPDSTTAAHAAHCADDQGLFWAYHDMLYNNWNGENNGWASSENLLRMAQDVGLNIDEFTDCMLSKIHMQIISASNADARTLGLTGTPGFFVIGPNNQITKIPGAQPYSVFENIIDDLIEEVPKLPEWVKNIFIWYAEDKISEDEIINALQFLIREGTIVV